jgi:hypothetical protein
VADQPLETVEAKTPLLFGFRAQLRSPFTNFLRQLCFPHSQFPGQIFCLRWFHQSVPCLSESACFTPGPLSSRLFQVLLCYYEPLRLPALAAQSVIVFRFRLCSFTHHQSGSPKFLVVLSVRAARLYPGKSSGWCQLPFQSLVLASALLSRLATFLFVFRGFGRRFAFAAARTCAVPEASAARLPSAARSASCLITLYMANSFQLTKTPRLSLAHQKEAKLQSPIPIFPRTTITRSRLALRGS